MPNPLTAPSGTLSAPQGPSVLQAVPTAVDLPSALHAINALAQNFALLNASVSSSTSSGSSSTTASAAAKSGFTVVSQKTQTIRITDPNDSTVYVDVEQITALTLYDPITNQTWTWTQ